MFDIVRFDDSNIFIIVKKDSLCGERLKLPIEVYGFLRVNGTNYNNSTISHKNIADEVYITYDELKSLEDLARIKFFQID